MIAQDQLLSVIEHLVVLIRVPFNPAILPAVIPGKYLQQLSRHAEHLLFQVKVIQIIIRIHIRRASVVAERDITASFY